MSLSKLAIVAGGGHLPFKIAQAAQKMGRPYFMVGLKGFVDEDALKEHPHLLIPLGKAGTAIKEMKREGVAEIVMIGPVKRPALTSLRPDWLTTKFIAKVLTKSLGDDGLLKAIAAEIESEGFKIIGAHELLQEIVAETGVYTKKHPHHQYLEDSYYGLTIAHEMGRLDIGQSVVIQEGLVLAVEAIEGTEALIKRSKSLIRENAATKPVLVKACKPQQDQRLDMPTIGAETVEQVYEAGFAGIAIEAGKTQFVDRERAIERADELGLFILGLSDKMKGEDQYVES